MKEISAYMGFLPTMREIAVVLRLSSEGWIWLAAILLLAFSPMGSGHYTLCLFRLVGIHWCPGCGLGRSISCLLHGDLHASFHHHWLGALVLIFLVYRIVKVFFNTYKIHKTKFYIHGTGL